MYKNYWLSDPIPAKRPFLEDLKAGSLNMVVTLPGTWIRLSQKRNIDSSLYTANVLKTVLTIYMENETLPLPTLEEVLICNSATTAEEVFLIKNCCTEYTIMLFILTPPYIINYVRNLHGYFLPVIDCLAFLYGATI